MTNKRVIPHLEKTIKWLLDSQTPSIRYLTLTRLQGLAENSQEATEARNSIAASPPALKILQAQRPEGFWAEARHVYSPKYRSSHWSMLLLSELGIDPENPGYQKGAAYMLGRIKADQPQPHYLRMERPGFGCFWGDFLRYQLYGSKGNIADVKAVVDFTCNDLERKGRCAYNSELPCAWSVVRGLFGLALIPESSRDETVQSAIKAGIHFLLDEYDLTAVNYPADNKPHPLWNKLSFPLYYHSDRLFVLRVLKELKALDHPSAQKALDWLQAKQTKEGIWQGGSPLKDKSRPFLAAPDGVERWITLQALEVLS